MTAEKDVQVARKKGRGGEVIWAMPERKHSFLKEVFPNSELMSLPKELLILTPLSTSVYSLCWKTSVKLSTSGLVKPCRPPTRRVMFQRRRGQKRKALAGVLDLCKNIYSTEGQLLRAAWSLFPHSKLLGMCIFSSSRLNPNTKLLVCIIFV